jgi:Bacterial mobilisation protein (MobC)
MMSCAEILKTTVPTDIKLQAKAIAERESLSEATWLKRLVLREIRACDGARSGEGEPRRTERVRPPGTETRGPNGCGKPILVRLRAEDRLLLNARAEARGLRPATYVSVLVRSHLRHLAPLPKDEFLALKLSIAELATIGRNINQIAKAVNVGGRVPGSIREEFRAMLKVCEALRDNTKALLDANVTSWETGYAQADF